jgi:signal transduction histidine kinase
MRERLAALGGTVALADVPGGGAELRARVPGAPVPVPGAAA